MPVYLSCLRFELPARTVPASQRRRVWPTAQPFDPDPGSVAAVPPWLTVTALNVISAGKQSITSVSCEGGRPLLFPAVRVYVTICPPITVVGLAAFAIVGFGSTTVTAAWAVRAGRSLPPETAEVLAKLAVLVRTVPFLLLLNVDI